MDLDARHRQQTSPGSYPGSAPDVADDANIAARKEHSLSFLEALASHKRALLWSVLVSASVIMEGYDIVLVTSMFAQPAFARQYGTYNAARGGWQLSGAWQSALGVAPALGAIMGAFANGHLAHRFGYRAVLLGSLAAMTAFISVLFWAPSVAALLAGLLLCGVPWGIFASLAPAYASEVCPLALRGYLAIYVNLCWALGQLLAAGVLEAFMARDDDWAFRIPFAIQWAWPLPLLVVLWFAPESPWWLLRAGHVDAAETSLRRLTTGGTAAERAQTIAMMRRTNEQEIGDTDESDSGKGTGYLDCFRGCHRRRTEIACVVFAAQVWCGSPLGGTPVYFFVQAGVSTSNSFKFSVGGLSLACLGTLVSWALLGRFGRRTLYVWGLAVLTLCIFVVGIVSAAAGEGSASSFTQAGFVLAWLFSYYITIGPVCYAIISEVSATRLRSKSICIARIAYYLCHILGSIIQPYMINPTEANWHGKAAFFWAATCFLCFVWAFFRLPETKNRTFAELDTLFTRRVKTRLFRTTDVHLFGDYGEKKVNGSAT